MSDETMPQPEQEAPKKRGGVSLFKVILFVVIIGVIVAGGYFLLGKTGMLTGAVAVVNGESITQNRFDDYRAQVAAVFATQGQDISSEEAQVSLRQRVIDDLIAETLVAQKAAEANIQVDATVVDAQLEQTKSQFADNQAYIDELTKQGFTESTFREMLERQNIFQQYIEKNIDLSGATVTEEEIDAFYEQASASSENIPALEEVRDQISAEILRQKQQAIVTQYIQNLRTASTVEIL